MSRSYKKTPYAGDRKDRFYKHFANRKMRKEEDLQDGREYRKRYCSWMICDYYDNMSLKEWLKWRGDDYASEEEAIRDYNKIYKRK